MRLLALPLALALAAPLGAQSFNLDFQDPASPWGTPADTYGGAADQVGHWSTIEAEPLPALRDVDGVLRPLEVVLPLIAFTSADTGEGAVGPPAALINDGWAPDPFTYTVTFRNLLPGAYRVYTYAASVNSIDTPVVTVEGVALALGGHWTGAHVEGEDHVVHDATVGAAGELDVTLQIIFGFMEFNGFQLVRLGDVGALTCTGDGTGPACPCGNDSEILARGCRHSGGEGMRLWGTGSASLAADDLVLTADRCPPSNSGLFFVGQQLLSPASLFDGLQCAGGSARRFQGRFQASGTVSDGGFVAQEGSGAYFVPGSVYLFQYFSRDFATGASPCGGLANLSPALRVVYRP